MVADTCARRLPQCVVDPVDTSCLRRETSDPQPHREQTVRVTDYNFADSIFVARAPEDLYDMVSDITRMGEWSPICKACWWDEGDGPRLGAHFTGRNEIPGQTWETRSEVVAADRGREFGWDVADGLVSWHYAFEPAEGGTKLTESWTFHPKGREKFREWLGDGADAAIAARVEAAHSGIPLTLAAIKASAESA
jgi:ribosome-associated toxin RatA of RatAB toxin-antitoxin module